MAALFRFKKTVLCTIPTGTKKVYNTLRKIATGIVVLLLLFNTVGNIILLKIQEHAIEEEFEHELKAGHIESNSIIQFTAADIANAHWENNHEIRLNGKYYDLVRTNKSKGITIYQFIADDEESDLFADYYTQHKQGKTKHAVAFQFPVFYQPAYTAHSFLNTATQTITTNSKALHEQNSSLPNFPPPQA
ncbi:MAG: hypothetical protein M0D57_11840 [Sphingobacteriales bacterium JAD_PAG50586_3]|nr:MAG: hypothetical protein M0D57_11840 [Sphingobacteriales bacterium JAD_PAG50586_3]